MKFQRSRRCRLLRALPPLLIAWAIASCGAPTDNAGQPAAMTIRPSDVSGEWPLTVDEVTVDCGNGQSSVFVEAGKMAYPLNGGAQSNAASYGGRFALGDLKSIQRRNPDQAKYGDIVFSPERLIGVAIQRCRSAGLHQI